MVARDAAGAPLSGVVVRARVARGGGRVEPSELATDENGAAPFAWTLGPAPVSNELAFTSNNGAEVSCAMRAEVAAPARPEPFGDLHEVLTGLNITGGTEDLAFAPDGERIVVSAPGGLYGVDARGLAFDAEGNLYLVLDVLDGLAIAESTVWVLPAGEDELHRFLSVDDRLIANLAFGQGAFGETTLYVSLLYSGVLTAEDGRGLMRAEVGIAGLPL